ncbi:hypothetical protein LTR91_020050 [Friedmanniomyces endolithicus]|uniref:MOSC domain-containing protein n=1 Tax=Friedmanniomyces endolithicus TaxID=329885 RepID=A0AAN6HCT1_9PEZI|nr:hypothetical protein LTR94_015075 [Friedmanniomyces endolithicus]KAK0780784.1 hypothetical protein LTR38_013961 [Friedmanniomyces endolithicus]KAK0792002.1 hypothetical protein LTR59_008702 [Friedmanniomyces endolithicus]KAK0800511.1 hypothetical protein LTR75_008903 [Friedmanniomyces endolithicus]KAK0860999.1 hypothetical protein LTS02_008110 [Friedmanniomyces endolithicus]
MKISKIYTYPIKGIREAELDSVVVTQHGFPYDRRYMLLQVLEDGSLKNMAIAAYPAMSRYFPALNLPENGDVLKGTFTVTYKSLVGNDKRVDIPLKPKTAGLERVEVMMHRSPTNAYKMPQQYNDFFTSTFGFDCILVYLGSDMRKVLMSTDGNKQASAATPSSWLSSLSSKATQLVVGGAADQDRRITFADCAPYLIVSDKSMDDVHSRMNDGEQYDIVKFRPNIIVTGAAEVWEEDFWAELTINGTTKIECEHNCARCRSLNIDFATGEPGTGEAGSMLKKLATNRRVDPGMKWSPVFGRYSFLHPGSEGNEIKVGDEVVVSRRNDERTKFDWEGLHTLPK